MAEVQGGRMSLACNLNWIVLKRRGTILMDFALTIFLNGSCASATNVVRSFFSPTSSRFWARFPSHPLDKSARAAESVENIREFADS